MDSREYTIVDSTCCLHFVGIELTQRTHRNTADEILLLVRWKSLWETVITFYNIRAMLGGQPNPLNTINCNKLQYVIMHVRGLMQRVQ